MVIWLVNKVVIDVVSCPRNWDKSQRKTGYRDCEREGEVAWLVGGIRCEEAGSE